MATAARPSADEMIDKSELDDLRQQIGARHEKLLTDIAGISSQWEQLGRMHGQRAEHAAAMLGMLRGPLRAMSGFCSAVETQINELIADPYGDGS